MSVDRYVIFVLLVSYEKLDYKDYNIVEQLLWQ